MHRCISNSIFKIPRIFFFKKANAQLLDAPPNRKKKKGSNSHGTVAMESQEFTSATAIGGATAVVFGPYMHGARKKLSSV